MQRCLEEKRASEALEIYQVICSSGWTTTVAFHVDASQGAVSIDQLARMAAQQVPHRQHQGSVLSLLMAAEAEDNCVAPSTLATAAAPLASLKSSPESWAGVYDSSFLHLTAAEQLRIEVRRQLHLLTSTGQLLRPLGKEYCLSEMRRICESAALQREVETAPLRCLGQLILLHPLTYGIPSLESARRQSLIDEVRRTWSSHAFTPAEQKRLLQITTATDSLRPLCRSSLLFLTTLAPNWDTIFIRRVAQTLLLPALSHSIFPDDYRREHGKRRQRASLPPCATWVDAAHYVFGQVEVATPADAVLRVEKIVQRRIHHDVVVPDAGYFVYHHHQLRQLAKYREIIVTHSVLLELVRLASLPSCPLRFTVRKVLYELMASTTTEQTVLEGCEARYNYSGHTRRRLSRNGITLLGLQDELALLDQCPDRMTLPPSSQCSSSSIRAAAVLACDLADTRLECSTSHLSVVMIAKQLERLITAHDRGEDFAAHDASTAMRSDMEKLVDHLLAPVPGQQQKRAVTSPLESDRCSGALTRYSAPLFQNRSRGLWARMPVVVATTSDETRTHAFMLGLTMYPPVSVVPY